MIPNPAGRRVWTKRDSAVVIASARLRHNPNGEGKSFTADNLARQSRNRNSEYLAKHVLSDVEGPQSSERSEKKSENHS
jgi:hypothetical protein